MSRLTAYTVGSTQRRRNDAIYAWVAPIHMRSILFFLRFNRAAVLCKTKMNGGSPIPMVLLPCELCLPLLPTDFVVKPTANYQHLRHVLYSYYSRPATVPSRSPTALAWKPVQMIIRQRGVMCMCMCMQQPAGSFQNLPGTKKDAAARTPYSRQTLERVLVLYPNTSARTKDKRGGP